MKRGTDLNIKPGQCGRCGSMIHLVEDAGLRWTAETAPLDAQTAVQALMDGRTLYRVTMGGRVLQRATQPVLKALQSAEPGERPLVVASHPCPDTVAKPLSASLTASQESGGTRAPKGGERTPVAPSRPSSGQPRASRPVPDAASRRFEINWSKVGATCSLCGKLINQTDVETYALIELGATVVDAFHTGACEA